MIHDRLGYWIAEAGGAPAPQAPLVGDDAADVVVVGGGYAGMWTAWELLAAHRGVVLAVEAPARPLVVRADRLRIAQALANLVANAVEHGGGEVRVRVRETAAGARVEVTDGRDPTGDADAATRSATAAWSEVH